MPAAPTNPPSNPVIPPPPSVVPIVDRNACLGTANGKIACTATSRFNICENGAFPTTVDQSCATTSLVCCAATGDCREATSCPVTVNKLCLGVPTNGVVCTSPSAYNICVGSGNPVNINDDADVIIVFLKAIDTTCPVGHECCSLYGGCVPIGSCVPTPPLAPAPGFVDSNLCVGTTGDKTIGCTSTTTFNICENGVFANAPSQSCQAGLICCASLNKCTTASECPSTNANLCSGVPDKVIRCTSTTLTTSAWVDSFLERLSIPLAQRIPNAALFVEAVYLLECAQLESLFVHWRLNIASAGGFFDASPCLGTAANKIACTGRTTFNICNAGGVFDNAPSQTCPGANAGVICCAKTGGVSLRLIALDSLLDWLEMPVLVL
ncbi:hypothetical protein BC829DRAFT_18774 [Chytridium lagenaria]|nr:hypothetical protein BC829DRAFT_18774 [Chytridium lagenaria]